MRKHERAARWVEVEALCLCAGLERQFGFASAEAVDAVEAPKAVKLAALRLLRQEGVRSARTPPPAPAKPDGPRTGPKMTPLAP
jgi:hypothetical protein